MFAHAHPCVWGRKWKSGDSCSPANECLYLVLHEGWAIELRDEQRGKEIWCQCWRRREILRLIITAKFKMTIVAVCSPMGFSVSLPEINIHNGLFVRGWGARVMCQFCVCWEEADWWIWPDIWLHLNEVIAVAFMCCSCAETILIIHLWRQCDTLCSGVWSCVLYVCVCASFSLIEQTSKLWSWLISV